MRITIDFRISSSAWFLLRFEKLMTNFSQTRSDSGAEMNIALFTKQKNNNGSQIIVILNKVPK